MIKQYSKPDFICIGLQKSGTTWVFKNLILHPDVYLTPVKEVKFLWGYGKKHQEGRSTLGNLYARFFGSVGFGWRKQYLKRRIRNHRSGKEKVSFSAAIWDIKYLFSPQTIQWYTSLFDPEKICGDLDPRYARFGLEEISKVKQTLPQVKIFVIFRNPLERIWSSLNMNLSLYEKKKLEDLSEEEVLKSIDILIRKYPNYSSIIEKWTTQFGPTQFQAFYMDELAEDTLGYYQRICHFIGIDYQRMGAESIEHLQNKVFAGHKEQMPAFIKRYIVKKTYSMIEEFYQKYPSEYSKQWLKAYQQIQNQDQLTNAE